MRPEGNPSRSYLLTMFSLGILDRLQEKRWAWEKFELVHCLVEMD